MYEIRASVCIEAPSDAVWAWLGDPERVAESAAVVRELCRIAELPPEGADLPEVFHACEAVAAGGSARVHRYVGPEMEVEVVLTAEPEGEGTRHRRVVRFRPTPTFRALAWAQDRTPLRALIRRTLRRDLEQARVEVERAVLAEV